MPSFVTEKALVNTFVECQAGFLKQLQMHQVDCKKEIDMGYGVSDIFYYKISKKTLNKRRDIKVEKISDKNLIEVLLKLNKTRSISFTGLKENLKNFTTYSQKKILKYLVENEFIVPKKNGEYFQVTKRYLPKIERAIAIEAKLKDWRRALFQAQRYNFVADQSFVALPKEYIAPAIKNLDDFKKYNVGLIAVSLEDVEIVFVPEKNSQRFKSEVMTSYTWENLVF